MSLPPHNPHGPSGCTCASAAFVNSSATGPLPASRNQYGFTNLQHSSCPWTQYNNTNTSNSQSRYYQPSQNVTPSATQAVPSPLNDRKRKNKSGRGRIGHKRGRQLAPAPASAICGVCPPTAVPTDSNLPENDPPPSSPQIPTIIAQPVNSLPAPSASTQLPSTLYPSPQTNQKPRVRSAAATDVWYFCRSSDSELRPTDLPSPDQEPTLTKKPRTPFVSCKLCKEWQVYRNRDGITTTMRNHLKSRHSEEYERVVSLLKLKHSNEVDHPMLAAESSHEPFNLDEWIRLMIRWIVTDDQAINALESPAFRDFILYGRDDVTESDLPHRMKLIELVFKAYEDEHRKLLNGFKSALGRISFTSDYWSDPNLTSFLALTAHFMARDINGHLVLRNHLLAFRVIEGKHDGKNLGRSVFEILKEAAVLGKIGEFTFGNASDCDSIMEAVEELLRAAGISFCRHGDCIRCFPRVINIAVQTILKELKENGYDPIIAASADPLNPSSELVEYATAVQSDLVGRTRRIVATCRKSGQGREDLQKLVATGNDTKTWGPDTNIRLVPLLRDCETRWSSTFNMIDRLIELYPLVERFLSSQPHMSEHTSQLFRQKEYEVLHHIHQILEVPRELLSAENTPTLSLALPAYETFVLLWKELAKEIPELSHYIDLGVAKIMEYVSEGRRSRIYALAMIINPRSKFKWIEEHWSASEAADAEKWMENGMLAHCRARRIVSTTAQQVPLATQTNLPASPETNPISARARLLTLFTNLSTARRIVSLPSASRSSSNTSAPTTSSRTLLAPVTAPPTEAEKAALEAEELARDLQMVRSELNRYKEEPLFAESAPLDLVRYWDELEFTYPLSYKVALDILPVQASAIPCERVFSSSKETFVLRRSLLSTGVLEILQVLKHLYEGERLDFTSHWIASEEDYSIERATKAAISELVSSAKFEELLDLLHNMDSTGQQ